MKQISVLLIIFTMLAACNEQTAGNQASTKQDEAQADTPESNSRLLSIVKQLPEYKWQHPYQLPELPYAYDALDPVIDAMTMETHHSKHHNGYTVKTNKFVEQYNLESKPVLQLFTEIGKHPVAVRNNAGGFYNHALFWTFLTPGGSEFKGEIAEAIKAEFESFEQFKSEFEKQAATQFGSGWAWLVLTTDGKLAVTQSSNQDNPLMPVLDVNGIPLLNLDVWEHAYYLAYKNKRGDYITNFWDIVNWKTVNERYLMAKKVMDSL